MEKILLFMPTYEEDGIIKAFPAALESFKNLKAPKGVHVDRVIGLDNPYGREGKHKNTLHQYQVIRKKMLDLNYDALVTFEHDMIVPEDGLIKLWEVDCPIVYGLYMLRHGAYCVNAFRYIKDSPNIHKSLTYLPREYNKAMKNGWARVTGVGMGFTVFRKAVLSRFDFRPSGESYPPDWAMAVDSTKAGMKQICRFDVLCGHIESNGLTVYPQRKGENLVMAKCKILKQFVSGDVYLPGQVADIPAEKVDDFVRAGYLYIIQDPDVPAVKIVNKPTKKSTVAVKNGLRDTK